FFQAEDGIRDRNVTGVQTCALPIFFVLMSTVVYLWIGMLSTRAVQIVCPSCEKPTKMLGRVDACMHCKQPLTLDKALECKEFDEKYNSAKYRRKLKKQNEQS